MSITAFMTLLGAIVMIGAWLVVYLRIHAGTTPVSQQIHFLKNFFLHMGLFCLCLFLPQIMLSIEPSSYPLYIAWGYTIGHVFAYIAFIYVLRLTFSMIPRLANKQLFAIVGGGIMATIITVLTVVTMVFGTLPTYDYENFVTLFNVSPVVGGLIGVFALLCVLPAAILMVKNGIHNVESRKRSFLLGGGLAVVMIAGPMHDIATTWQVYMTADMISIVGFLVLAGGVLYRFEERIAPSRVAKVAPAPSI